MPLAVNLIIGKTTPSALIMKRIIKAVAVIPATARANALSEKERRGSGDVSTGRKRLSVLPPEFT